MIMINTGHACMALALAGLVYRFCVRVIFIDKLNNQHVIPFTSHPYYLFLQQKHGFQKGGGYPSGRRLWYSSTDLLLTF